MTDDDFSVAVSMRGHAAHLTVRGSVDDDGAQTLQDLLSRLPAADVTEAVVDLTSADGDHTAVHELIDVTTSDPSLPIEVTVEGDQRP